MNLNLVIDTSQFKPLEWYKAAVDTMKDYGTTYQRYEDALNKIAEEKGEYVLPESSKYKGVMDLYNTDFDAIVGDFGRTMNTRILLNVRDMRKRYHSEISPIRKMVENYNKAMDKLTALGPDAIIGGKDLLTNVDTYYGGVNPNIDYRSDKTIQQTAAGIMQGLDNALMSAPKLAGSIAKQYMIFRQLGLDGANALNEILKMLPSLNNELAANDISLLAFALDKVYSHFAFKDPNTPENRAIWESVVTGAILGIQAPKYSMQQDRNFESDADRLERQAQQKYRDFTMAKTIAEAENEGLRYDSKSNTFSYDPTLYNERNPQKPKDVTDKPIFHYNGKDYIIDKSLLNDDRLQISEIDPATGKKEIVRDPVLKKEITEEYSNIMTNDDYEKMKKELKKKKEGEKIELQQRQSKKALPKVGNTNNEKPKGNVNSEESVRKMGGA